MQQYHISYRMWFFFANYVCSCFSSDKKEKKEKKLAELEAKEKAAEEEAAKLAQVLKL